MGGAATKVQTALEDMWNKRTLPPDLFRSDMQSKTDAGSEGDQQPGPEGTQAVPARRRRSGNGHSFAVQDVEAAGRTIWTLLSVWVATGWVSSRHAPRTWVVEVTDRDRHQPMQDKMGVPSNRTRTKWRSKLGTGVRTGGSDARF